MPLLRKWNYKNAVIGIWQTLETFDELKDMLSGFKYVDEELLHYKSDSRKIEYLAVRVLLMEMCNENYRILHTPSGKPYLEDSGRRISISHTRGYVAVIVHPENEVGIDIEFFSERVQKVVSRFVRDDEMEYLNHSLGSGKQNESDYIFMLLLLWSGKETLYKIINRSEVDFKEHLHIFPFELSLADDASFIGAGEFLAKEYKSLKQEEFSMQYILHKDFVCTYSVND